MGLFDLLFIVLFVTSVATSIAAAWFALQGQFSRVRRILSRLLIGAVVYMGIVIAMSLLLPRRVVNINASQCFDDWCISIAGFKRSPEWARVAYSVDLRLSSRARRVSQRENNLVVYLTDDHDRRYYPVAEDSTPFNVLLRPQESAVVRRLFLLPAEATDVAMVITHEGGFPIGRFIIGYDSWFRKPPKVRLQ